MKFWRIFFLSLIFAGGFLYLTSVAKWSPRRLVGSSPGGPLWSEPKVVRSAGLSADETNNIEIYKSARAATVNITTTIYRRDWFYGVVPDQGSGSGFIVDQEGRILTNNHVVSGPRSEITVTLDDRSRHKAVLLARDTDNDLALIQIKTSKRLPVLPLGDSDKLQVGQKVLAIGNPFGLTGTLTTGVISSLGRSIRGERQEPLEDLIQTDAAINPGNSGGPLLDSQGSVIGVNTAILGAYGNIGIGFAMPINRAKSLLTAYAEKGRFTRPVVGVRVFHVQDDLAEALGLPASGGLLVLSVERGSPADRAGIRGANRAVIVGNYEIPVGGDLITAIDGKPVEDREDLRRALVKKRPGDPLDLTIFRDGRTTKVRVTLGEAGETAI